METRAFPVCSRCHEPVGAAGLKECSRCGAVFAADPPRREDLLPKRSPVGGIITPQ